MKRPLLITWLGGQLLYLVALYAILSAGVAAQRTHNYSVLRELEIKGLLVTDSAALIEAGQPGQSFATMNPLRSFHIAGLLLSGGWTLVSALLFAGSARKRQKPS